eukprot:5050595-Karenia_brevis.AAC.1
MDHLIEITDDGVLEPWVDFIKRATRVAETHIDRCKIQEWHVHHLRKTWKWAARVAQQPTDRWSKQVALWAPQLHNPQRALRPQARPRKRWDDTINTFLHQHLNNSSNTKSTTNNS